MVGGGEKADRKKGFFAKIIKLFEEYPCAIIVGADFVGSSHMQQIRKALRAQNAVMLCGKNTMVRKAIRGQLPTNPKLEAFLPFVYGHIGFVFCKGNLADVRKTILAIRVSAAAKPGVFAPCDVIVPAGNTGMEPTQTSFLQALNIATKISKGQIEIIKDVFLISKGQKVGSSEAALLGKLNIKPFTYGLEVLQVYDNGAIYDPAVLDLTDDDLLSKFSNGVRNLAAVSLQTGIPTLASAPHSLSRGFKNVLSVSVATKYTFEHAKKIKEYIANPAARAAAAPAPAAAAPKEEKKAEAKPAAKAKEPEPEEEEMDMGGLFG